MPQIHWSLFFHAFQTNRSSLNQIQMSFSSGTRKRSCPTINTTTHTRSETYFCGFNYVQFFPMDLYVSSILNSMYQNYMPVPTWERCSYFVQMKHIYVVVSHIYASMCDTNISNHVRPRQQTRKQNVTQSILGFYSSYFKASSYSCQQSISNGFRRTV